MQGQPFGLLVLLIPAKIEPAQTLKNRVHRGISVAFDIGIVKPQDHGSAVMAGVKPVKNERAGAANVQKTSRRGCKSNAEHDFRVYRDSSRDGACGVSRQRGTAQTQAASVLKESD